MNGIYFLYDCHVVITFLSLNWFIIIVQFIIDMHHKVTAAAHHRHKCNHLAGIEVLVDLLEFRAAIPSTFK